jgi:nucleoside-diphosphate-sugar epimerase
MKNKTILVTGANGYIGRHVTKYLLDQGQKVYALDMRFSEIDSRAIPIEVNIFGDKSDLDSIIKESEICLHLAWRNGFNHNAETHITDLPHHYNFISHVINSGIKHIAVLGSMHEIGYWEGAIDDNTPTNPRTLYGIAKNALRQSVQVLTEKSDVIFQWLRAFYIYGDDRRNHSIFSKLAQSADEGKISFPVTSGKNQFDFINIDTLSMQISLAILQDQITGNINCCSGHPMSLREAVNEFIRVNNFNIVPDFGAYPDRAYDSPAIWGDDMKIQKIMENAKSRS